jgi:S1-C subfamily serine protease
VDVGVVARDLAGAPLPPPEGSDAGLILRAVASLGSEVVAVRPGGAAAQAGLAVGDIIVRLNGRDAPGVAEILRAYRDADSGAALLLTVQRGTRQVVAALEKP